MDQQRNQNFELHNSIGQHNTMSTMQKSEIELLRRRIDDLQRGEAALLTEKQKLVGERDAIQFAMASLAADLSNQKSLSFLQAQRHEQESVQAKEQLVALQARLEAAQSA